MRAGVTARRVETAAVPLRQGLILLLAWLFAAAASAQQPLPSWNDGPARARILAFVQAVTDKAGKDYVEPAQRVAVFDNDGTLWSEQPLYFQFLFALEQVKAAAPKHPEWKDDPAFQALMKRDHAALAKLGMKPVLRLLTQANSGMTTDEYDRTIRQWLETAHHPRFNRPYTELTFLPMREVLDYLREHGFKTYIVSGGSIEFMRPWAEKAYGIPPEQVVGTISQVKYEIGKDGVPVLRRLPNLFEFVDDGPGKPIGIYRAIGQRPLAAVGNSDGDLQMLQYTTAGTGPRLALIVRHTDEVREWAYDRKSRIGRLDKALDQAEERGWTVVDMKKDWKKVYAFEP